MSFKKKSMAFLLAAVMTLNISAVSAFAAPTAPEEQIITTATTNHKSILDRTGPDYSGDIILAQNLNKTISSQEELIVLENTGLPASDPPPKSQNASDDISASSGADFIYGAPHLEQPSLDSISPANLKSTFATEKKVYKIGDTKDFLTESYVDTTAQGFTGEVVYTTDNCTIWRDKAHPEQFTNEQAKKFGDLFDSKYKLMFDAFGETYDADNDGKTAFVFYPMAKAPGGVMGGFFYSKDIFTKEEADWANGNAMDMLNMNSIRLNDGKSEDFMKATLFHEYQHLINYSQTFGYSDSWLNETFSMSATAIVGLSNNNSVYHVQRMFKSLADKGYTSPFIFYDYYVPRQGESAILPYAQWYLFGRYLSNQTKDLAGGGDEIYKTILNSLTMPEGNKLCTIASLEKALTDIGYMGAGKTVEDLDEFITNYNTALLKQDPTGIYSICTNPNFPAVVDNVDVPSVTISAAPANKAIPGGGSAMYSYYASQTATPVSPAAAISFAGIPSEIAPIKSDVLSGQVAVGTKVSLSCETPCADIYYTLDGSVPTEETGILYNEPIVINDTTTIKAIGLVTGYPYIIPGSIHTFTFDTGSGSGDKYEPNDATEQSTATSFPSKLKANITTAADIDMYTFSLDSETRLSLTLTPPTGTSYALTLFDSNNKQLADSRIANASQNLRHTAPSGKYFLKVASINKTASAINPYELNIQREFLPDDLKTLDFSEMNMLTALSDKSETTSGYAYDAGINGGGHFLMSMAYLSHWAGPVLEGDDPYNDSGEGDSTKYKNLSGKSKHHVQNALYLPNADNPDFYDGVKNAVNSYGAVSVFVQSADCYWTEDNKNLFVDSDYTYKAKGYDGGHIVTIVGWDDNYPKENFKGNPALAKALYPDKTVSIPQPKENGAFIVKNSWGSDICEEGYFYVSYEDAFIKNNTPCVFLADEMPDNYNHQYMNDPYGTVSGFGDFGGFTSTAVFTNESANTQLLRAASFVSMSANTKYEISVTILDETQILGAGTKRYAGFYTERFDKSISIPAGCTFSINVYLENTDPSEHTFIGICKNTDGLVSGVPSVPGIAFITSRGEKEDVGSYGTYPNIRAYTYDPTAVGYSESVLGAASAVQAAALEERKPLSAEFKAAMDASSIEYISQDTASVNGGIGITIPSANSAKSPETNFPERFDLRDTGTLTPVKDQKDLGACWAFSAIACVENFVARNGGNSVNYPKSITLSDSEKAVLLTTDTPEQDVVLSAALDTENASSGRIIWSVSGDVSSVKLKTDASLHTESVPVLTAVKPGTVTVTATSDADMTVSASCTVTITAQGVEKIVLTPDKFELKKDESKQIAAKLSPDTAIDKTVIWQSDNPEIANVDASGKVTAISGGTAIITAKAGTAAATATVTVNAPKPVDPSSSEPVPSTPVTPDASSGPPSKPAPPAVSAPTTPTGTTPTNIVNTSDSTPLALIVLLGLGALVSACVIFRKKKR